MNEDFLDEEVARKLIASVLIQMIRDWKSLEYGKYKEAPIPGGKIERDEIIDFVRRGDFDAMLQYVAPISPTAAHEALKMEKITTEQQPLNGGEIDALRAMAANSMNIYQAAIALKISRKVLYKRLRNIETKTGVDPRNFWGLRKLLIDNTEDPRQWDIPTE